ncbi:magnesium transporter [candidate division WOR-3 bacterium]|nr:magnesium transporter [candidate division WOR-3 bacterium]
MNTKNALLESIDAGRFIVLPKMDKDEALSRLADLIESSPLFLKESRFRETLFRREAQTPNYLGYGIAMPHANVQQGDQAICAIGWSPSGIDYGNPDNWLVHLLLMYCVPVSVQNQFLNEISILARAIENDPAKHELVNLPDSETVCSRIRQWLDPSLNGKISGDKTPQDQRLSNSSVSHILLPDVIDMIRENRLKDLQVFLGAQPAPEIADMISEAQEQDCVLIFRLLPRQTAAEVFSLLDLSEQETLLRYIAGDEAKQILTSLTPDDRTALFEELPAPVTQRLLGLLDDKDRKETLTLLSYPENSVGRLMTNRYVTARSEWTCEHAIENIRKTGKDSETIVMVYIIDDKGKLLDDLPLRSLIMAQPKTLVKTLLDGRYVALHSLQDQEDAVNVFKKYDLYALPVVDSDGVILGIVTADDILDISEEEATEDFHKGAAVRPLEEGYLKSKISLLYRNRMPWLVTLVFINIFSGAGIACFESLIASYVALVFFLPLLIGSGGNAGSQSATLVIRSMALGEVNTADFAKMFFREIAVSLGLALTMACAVFLLGWWRSGMLIALVVAVSMIAVVVFSSLIGMVLPFILRKTKIDPAAASAPLVTSLADIFGVLIYFGIATFLIKLIVS